MREKKEATDIVPVRSATPTVDSDPLSKGKSPRLSYVYVEEEG